MPPAVNSPEAKLIISAVKKSLVEMALWDIHRVFGKAPPSSYVQLNSDLKDGIQAIASVFLLGGCLIDAAGNFIIPCPPQPKPGKRPNSQSHKAFTSFCKEFMKRNYDADVLYSATRCGLAHAYTTASSDPTVPESYWLTHNLIPAHLQADVRDPRIRYINAQNFIVDLTTAVSEMLDAVENNRNLSDGAPVQPLFLAWAELCGFMAVRQATPAGAAATAAAALWSGLAPPPLQGPLRGTGAARVQAVTAGSASGNCTLEICASGWSGFGDLGIPTGGWTLQAPVTPSLKVDVSPNFEINPHFGSKKKRRGGR